MAPITVKANLNQLIFVLIQAYFVYETAGFQISSGVGNK
jgi:hypothetical protein